MPKYYRFEVALCGIQPRIWRRFLLPSRDSTFADLHLAIQRSFGWGNAHVHCFVASNSLGTQISGGSPVRELEREMPESRHKTLSSYFKGKRRSCIYVYDFGDDWRHKVELLGTASLRESFLRRLEDGQRAGPQECLGGMAEYEARVTAIRTSSEDRTAEQSRLVHRLGNWNPDGFDLKVAAEGFNA